MSNKIVPIIYRAVIDDVIGAIKAEFDEYGVAEDVLAELQHKWENKVIASHVAEFETPQQQPPAQALPHPQQHHHNYPPHPMHMLPTHPHYAAHNPYAAMAAAAAAASANTTVKAEPADNRYMLNPGISYTIPPLPGPNLTAARSPVLPQHPGGQAGVLNFTRSPQAQSPAAPTARTYIPPTQSAPAQSQPLPPPQLTQPPRIPQVDGPSESSGEEDSPSPPPSAFAPRTMHPSLPQPITASVSQQPSQDSEAINSDLDDSDTENEEEAEEGGAGESDIVFCTYDKVARVKNKWKCILKDGMIHVNGKDYLFAKCTGEFEW